MLFYIKMPIYKLTRVKYGVERFLRILNKAGFTIKTICQTECLKFIVFVKLLNKSEMCISKKDIFQTGCCQFITFFFIILIKAIKKRSPLNGISYCLGLNSQ